MPKTNPIGKNKELISTTVEDEIMRLIIERAESVNQTKGAFTRAIIEDWFNRGAPPVNDVDRAMMAILKAHEADKQKTVKGKPIKPAKK